MFALLSKRTTSDYRAPVLLDGHISYGQSWRSNDFPSFGSFGLNPDGPIAFMIASMGAFLGPGPLSGSAGINLTGPPVGTTNYQESDTFMIGRCAVLAQQLLRLNDGVSPLPPLLEFCTAFPASTWRSGQGGGLAPGSVFTGSISGFTLTVTALTSGFVAGGQVIAAAGVDPITRVYANLSSTRTEPEAEALLTDNPDGLTIQQLDPGGVGTYQLTVNFASLGQTFTGSGPSAVFFASANYGVMTVTSISSGSLAVGQVISAPTLPIGTTFQQQISGTPGGLGVYLLGLPQTVASTTMNGKGISWTNMLTILAATPVGAGVFPTHTYSKLGITSIGYTQGGSVEGTIPTKIADLTDMLVQFDALALNAQPLKLYLALPSNISTATTFPDSGTQAFARTNAPGLGGPYSGRVYATGPSYQYPFNGGDNIHTNAYGTSRWGEIEGYVRWLVQDKGIDWTPLWRPLTGGAITRSGQVLTVPFARPAGPMFATAVMSWQNNADDGVKDWPQQGFSVRRAGAFLSVSPAISGMNVLLTVTEALNAGDVLEVSYASYGPGGPNPGPCSGVGGNLVMQGPPSVLYPNGWNGAAKTIDAWAWPFIETVTV